jgi:FKBP-type peptidyl-prolyl cis-trans isomerase
MGLRHFGTLVLVALATAACSPGDGQTPPAPAAPETPARPKGLRTFQPPPAEREIKTEVVTKGDGREVKSGDTVLAHFVFTVADTGKKLADTRAEGDPQPLEVGAGYNIAALEQAVLKMRVGDRWKISAPYQLAYGEQGYPPLVPPRADLLLDVEVVGFLEIQTETLAEGAGPAPMPEDYVLFHAVGSLANGTVFEDTRKADAPLLLTMGVGKMIHGWYLTLRKMKVGDRRKVTLPWRFAYGLAGRPPVVPPKADVVFDLERLPLPEVKLESLTQGKGAPCAPGASLSVHYVGTLLDGKKFDSSRDRGEPFAFQLWRRPPDVIAGWELALLRMRVGDRTKVTIPWQLAYGAQGRPPDIPPRADLVFDIEVLASR